MTKPTETAIAMCRAWEDLKDHVLEVGDMCYSNFFKRTFKVCGKDAHWYILKNVPTEGPWYCVGEDLIWLPSMEAALGMVDWGQHFAEWCRNNPMMQLERMSGLINRIKELGDFQPETWLELTYAFVNHELYGREWKEGGWR